MNLLCHPEQFICSATLLCFLNNRTSLACDELAGSLQECIEITIIVSHSISLQMRRTDWLWRYLTAARSWFEMILKGQYSSWLRYTFLLKSRNCYRTTAFPVLEPGRGDDVKCKYVWGSALLTRSAVVEVEPCSRMAFATWQAEEGWFVKFCIIVELSVRTRFDHENKLALGKKFWVSLLCWAAVSFRSYSTWRTGIIMCQVSEIQSV